MSTRWDKKTSEDLVRLVIFMVVTAMLTAVLVVLIGNLDFGDKKTYKADFTDVTGVNPGDDVRIAGVRVGSISGVDIINRSQARVTFDVQASEAVSRTATAAIRYRNLVGQRYLSLTPAGGQGPALPANGVIPISQTTPALDLTTLFNGFKPLFAALTPEDVNKLTYEIVQVFQGEGGTLQDLLTSTASITNTLADRDQVIGDLITNLNQVLVTVASRNTQLNALITELQVFLNGLVKDKDALLGPLDDISNLSVQTSQLLDGLRPSLVQDISHLKVLAGNLSNNLGVLDSVLQITPEKYTKVGRLASNGSFLNFYLCQFTGSVAIGPVAVPIPPTSVSGVPAARCNL